MAIIRRIVNILIRIEKLLLDILICVKKEGMEASQSEVLLNSTQVKQMLNVSDSTLYRYKKQHILEPTAVNGKFYRKSDVLRHLNHNSSEAL